MTEIKGKDPLSYFQKAKEGEALSESRLRVQSTTATILRLMNLKPAEPPTPASTSTPASPTGNGQ